MYCSLTNRVFKRLLHYLNINNIFHANMVIKERPYLWNFVGKTAYIDGVLFYFSAALHSITIGILINVLKYAIGA